MSSIIFLTAPNILPGLIVCVFVGILNFFVFLLLIANKKLPVGQRFLEFSDKNPKIFLNDLYPAFQDWDGFILEYEDIINNYKKNYEKITGVEIEDSEPEEMEDRELKPYYVMNDFSDMFSRSLAERDPNHTSEIYESRSNFVVSKIGNVQPIEVEMEQPLPFKSQAKTLPDSSNNSDKNLFANKELLKFFGLEKKQNFKGIDEVEIENSRKTAQLAFIQAPGIIDFMYDEGELFSVHRKSTQELIKANRNDLQNLGNDNDFEDGKNRDWKPFMIGDFQRKSMNLNEDVGGSEEDVFSPMNIRSLNKDQIKKQK